ncbi:ROK family protein [Pontibacter russatus]|uniref:ROK family protein n=1 Tax=Pontibacter russatus TaxID=2694929 RepID=UPI00137B2D4C|nr:ROK family protein [Pontibacter russatus]
MKSQKIICIDMGATKVHIGVVQDGVLLTEVRLPTSAHASQEQVLAEIAAGIAPLLDAQVAGIGIGVPGLVDDVAGCVYDVVNIPSWQEVPLRQYLEDRFHIPVYLTNDANTFVLGEKMYGKAKPYKNVVGITLGTGMGAGIIINNSLYTGTLSGAGEFGSVPYLDKTYDSYCGGKFFLSRYGLEGSVLRERASGGDKEAIAAFQEYGQHVGSVVNLILYTLSPEAIFLGGSVSKSYPLFKEAMFQCLRAFPFKRVTDRLVIEPSDIDNAALLGAAALYQLRSAEKASVAAL